MKVPGSLEHLSAVPSNPAVVCMSPSRRGKHTSPLFVRPEIRHLGDRTGLRFGVHAGSMPRLLFVTLLLLESVYGIDPPQEEARMVDLNVVALDAHGAPVTDLTRDDFRIADAGKPEAIAFFRHRDSAAKPAPRLAPGEYSNRSAANVPRATLILFDMLNQKFGTRGTTNNDLIHDLQSVEATDYVYLYILTVNGGLFPVHGLPGAEGEASPPGGEPWTRHVKEMMDKALKDVLQVREAGVVQDVEWRARMTFRALDALGVDLSRIPGRKSIVWLSDGVPIELGPRRSESGDFVDFTPLLRQMTETMDRSNVSIYAVRTIMIGSSDNITLRIHPIRLPGEEACLEVQLPAPPPTMAPKPGHARSLRQPHRRPAGCRQRYRRRPSPSYQRRAYQLSDRLLSAGRKLGRQVSQTAHYLHAQRRAHSSQDRLLRLASSRAPSRRKLSGQPSPRASMPPRSASPPELLPLSGLNARLEARIDAHDLVLVHQGDSYRGQLRVTFAILIPGRSPS